MHITQYRLKKQNYKGRWRKRRGFQAIVNNLTAHFPSSDIIQAARIFDPAAVPGSDTDCAAHGEGDLLLLTSSLSSYNVSEYPTPVSTNCDPQMMNTD